MVRAADPVAGTATPVFVCGTGGGGTSLLLRLLDGHPSLAVLPDEAQLYRTLTDRFLSRQLMRAAEIVGLRAAPTAMVWPLLAPLTFRGRSELRSRLLRWSRDFPVAPAGIDGLVDEVTRAGSGPAEIWTAALRLYEALSGVRVAQRRFWVEKTPGNERYAGLSERLFEGSARWIHVVRDPRDLVASRVRDLPAGVERSSVVTNAVVTWSRSIAWCWHNQRAFAPRYRFLRYEDLVRRPAEEMAGICDFLGIPMRPEVLWPSSLGRVVGANSSSPDARDSEGIVIRERTGRYPEVLDRDEVAFIQNALGGPMCALGYDLDQSAGSSLGSRHGPRGLRDRLKIRTLRRSLAGGGGSPRYQPCTEVPTGSSRRWPHRLELPVMGVPLTFRTDSPSLIERIESVYGTWSALGMGTGDQVAGPGGTINIALAASADREFSGFTYRVVEPRLEIQASIGWGFADHVAREAIGWATPELMERPDEFSECFLEAMTLFLIGSLDREPVHAAAVLRNGVAILLEGRSGTGKSTLTYAASRAGFTPFSDEAVYVQTQPRLRVWSRRARIQLRPEAREHFAELREAPVVELPGGKRRVLVRPETERRWADRVGICILERGNRAELSRIGPEEVVDLLDCHLEAGFDRYRATLRRRAELLAARGSWKLTLCGDPGEGVRLLSDVADELAGGPSTEVDGIDLPFLPGIS